MMALALALVSVPLLLIPLIALYRHIKGILPFFSQVFALSQNFPPFFFFPIPPEPPLLSLLTVVVLDLGDNVDLGFISSLNRLL